VRLEFFLEGEIPTTAVASLLDLCFPNVFEGRTYFKQLPQSRLLLSQKSLIAQVGLDLRMIRVGEGLLRVLGIIDLAVAPDQRNRGLGSQLLAEAESKARQWQADFLILFADQAGLYQRNGYHAVRPAHITWLGIESRASCGLLSRDQSGIVWAKSVAGKTWPAGPIDLLGYLF
jgi:GNAT superfamily N-acetyltransferase